MTWTLVRKLLRDIRVPLIVVAVLLAAFQCLWANVTERIIGQLSPFFARLAAAQGLLPTDLEAVIFDGPGKIIRTLIGGETVKLQRAMDMLSIGYVHPLMQTIFCIWAIGRAAGAIAGEIDRGTMELLLAQPLGRARLVFAHLCVDCLTIPVLCLSLYAGSVLGCAMITPIRVQEPDFTKYPFMKAFKEDPAQLTLALEVRMGDFARAMPGVAGLMFAVSGCTMWLSSAGRFRGRVLGLAVLVFLMQFLVNLIGQMWDLFGWLRPLTIFYYFQPQKAILGQGSGVDLREWNGGEPLVQVPVVLVLFAVGAIGYLMALRTFTRRDIPAPL